MLRKTTVENGLIQGVACGDPRITIFKGVPYAAPPIGDLRWKSPHSHANWEGVYMADTFPPMEIQTQPGSNPDEFWTRELNPCATEYPMSEDCLYLNIWTPAKTEKDNLPVYLWIHGGGLQAGYSYEMEFDGERVARRDVIFVTVGYRLNVFSFLAHPELTAENPNGCHGNYGLEDIVFALQWIQRNIKAFGGDPSRVTIGGQSGGALGVISLCASPMVKGLISGAIAQSGGGLRAFGYGNQCTPLTEAQKYGIEFLNQLGVSSIEEARKISAEKIYEAYQATAMHITRWSPVIDGCFLMEDPTDAMLHNHHLQIPYLFGSNAGEGLGTHAAPSLPQTMEEFESMVHSIFGEKTNEFLQLCNIKNMEDVRILCQSETFNTRTIPVLTYSIKQAEQGRVGYFYEFNHDIPGKDCPGPYHGSELWFTFESLGRCWRPFTGKHYDLARKVCTYWTNFIKTGNPNGLDSDGVLLPEWQAYTLDNSFIMEFSDDPARKNRDMSPTTNYRIQHHLSKNNEKLM